MDEVYGREIHFIRCSLGYFRKIMVEQENLIFDQSDDDVGMTLMDGRRVFVWLSPKANIGVLVHEIFHAACHILGDAGVHLVPDTEETYAYFIQYLYDKLKVYF